MRQIIEVMTELTEIHLMDMIPFTALRPSQVIFLQRVNLFLSIDLRLDNNFILSFGARWEDWEANYKDSNQESFKPSDNMNGGKISLSNNQSENTTFFASVAKGYKQGGFNLGTGLNNSEFNNSSNYDPESLINYEVGINKLLPNADGYLDLVFSTQIGKTNKFLYPLKLTHKIQILSFTLLGMQLKEEIMVLN